MTRKNWLTIILNIFIILTIISACSIWQRRNTPQTPQKNTSTENTKQINVQHAIRSNDDNTISYNKLPPEAQRVIRQIQTHGTFEFPQDGRVFQNREGILPIQPRGYYQEYTVITPNATNRGARRIIAGKGTTGDAATSGEFYYTPDHYRSFYQVKE